KLLGPYFVDPQNWGTFATFTFLDEKSFTSKEELESAVNKMNPTANFYNAIFNYVIGTVKGWNKADLTEQEHTKKRLELANQYKDLKENGKLLVDILDDKFFEELNQLPFGGKVEKWWESPNNKLITDYKIGDYSERPSYKVYSLNSLVQLVKDQEEFYNNS